jgi:hypothetical protein
VCPRFLSLSSTAAPPPSRSPATARRQCKTDMEFD